MDISNAISRVNSFSDKTRGMMIFSDIQDKDGRRPGNPTDYVRKIK
jgi:hypothetical protein